MTNTQEQDNLQEFILNQTKERNMILNQIFGRRGFLSEYLDVKRDVDRECGYPTTSQLDRAIYKEFYDRHPLATRVVEIMPKESWKIAPIVFESENPEVLSSFDESWRDLCRSLQGGSRFKGNKGNPVYEYLKRADILSGISHFGVLFIGLDDGLPLSEPVEPRAGQKVNFLRAFDESQVKVSSYTTDENNTRWGMPERYSIDFSVPTNVRRGAKEETRTLAVHWSRVIHLADNLGSNEIFGVPRIRPVFNRLWDTRKLYGGSAEMFWRGAFPGIFLETHPQLGGQIDINKEKLAEEMLEMSEGLKRYMALRGMSAKSIAPQVSDPSNHIERQIEGICIQLEVPKRIFMGSERGELSSSQDKGSWEEKVQARRDTYVTPRIIVSFVDRLINIGVLEEPDSYQVSWPEKESESKKDKAEINLRTIETLAKYVQGDVDVILPPIDLYTKILEWRPEQAMQVLESAVGGIEDN